MARLLAGVIWAEPKNATSFPNNTKILAMTLGGLGELNWKVGKNVFLIARLPIELMSFSIDQTEVENPVLTERQRRTGGFAFDLLGNNVFPSLGVGFDL